MVAVNDMLITRWRYVVDHHAPWTDVVIRSVCCAGLFSWLRFDWIAQKVPDDDGVVMGTAHDLELVELQAENSARVLLFRKRLTIKKDVRWRFIECFRALTVSVLKQRDCGGSLCSNAAFRSQILIFPS